MKEIVIIPTYRRAPLLFGCLAQLRHVYSGPVVVFPDRDDHCEEYHAMSKEFDVLFNFNTNHNYYGNSSNAGRALQFAYATGAERIHYLEDDAFVDNRWYSWTHDIHSAPWGKVFCSAGWVFNRERPIEEDTYFVPWIYIPQFTIKRDKLAEIIPHLVPEYFGDMRRYIMAKFPNTPLRNFSNAINHWEIDGLIQHIIMADTSNQVAWNAHATVAHMGFAGYNRGGYEPFQDFFDGCKDFMDKVKRVEDLYNDHAWRASLFGHQVVEREIGMKINAKHYVYKIELPGGYVTFYETTLHRKALPKVICSMPMTPDTKITLVSSS